MIAFVQGQVVDIENDGLILEIGGIGIAVLAPMSRLQPRPVVGETCHLYTHLQVREDAWTLYGFSDKEQLNMFRLLLGVTGVGAKTALAIVDLVNPSRFASAIAGKDVKTFTAVSGVGKKSAERILLELKDKVSAFISGEKEEESNFSAPQDELDGDLLAALKQLGYTATEARAFALGAQATLGSNATTEQLLREALRIARTA